MVFRPHFLLFARHPLHFNHLDFVIFILLKELMSCFPIQKFVLSLILKAPLIFILQR